MLRNYSDSQLKAEFDFFIESQKMQEKVRAHIVRSGISLAKCDESLFCYYPGRDSEEISEKIYSVKEYTRKIAIVPLLLLCFKKYGMLDVLLCLFFILSGRGYAIKISKSEYNPGWEVQQEPLL